MKEIFSVRNQGKHCILILRFHNCLCHMTYSLSRLYINSLFPTSLEFPEVGETAPLWLVTAGEWRPVCAVKHGITPLPPEEIKGKKFGIFWFKKNITETRFLTSCCKTENGKVSENSTVKWTVKPGAFLLEVNKGDSRWSVIRITFNLNSQCTTAAMISRLIY